MSSNPNPAWWERAISGTCSHGGHEYDGDTCSDANMFTADQQHSIAGVLMSLRGEGSMKAHRQMLNWVTDAMASMLADDNPAFNQQRFLADAGRIRQEHTS